MGHPGDGQSWPQLLSDSVYITAFCALFVAAVAMAMRTGDALDRAVAAARGRAESAASASAVNAQRRGLHAFVHDNVMSTLLELSREGNSPALAVRSADTLGAMASLMREGRTDEPMSVEALFALLTTEIGFLDDDVLVVEHVDPTTAPSSIPSSAGRALMVATLESVRNSVSHAGDRTDRIVRLGACAGEIEVVVADNGRGFHWDAIAPDRLGIVISIRGQMANVSGCSTEVVTTPGVGTAVTLGWCRAQSR